VQSSQKSVTSIYTKAKNLFQIYLKAARYSVINHPLESFPGVATRHFTPKQGVPYLTLTEEAQY
jgi:hypothetical protein